MMNNNNDKYIITIVILGLMLITSLVLGILLIRITDDLKATANGYESDRNICRREYEELVSEYKILEQELNK